MKKYILALAAIFFLPAQLLAQSFSSAVFISKTWSQNGKFYIRCIPFDNETPSLRGESAVYSAQGKLLYKLNRDFDDLRDYGNYLGLSNDGQSIIYIVAARPDEKTDGLHSVNVYKKDKLIKSYTLQDITGCDIQNARCRLMYYNLEKIIDGEKSHQFTAEFKKVYKEGVSDEDKFLDNHAIFINKDTAYITDPDKKVHAISLKTGVLSAPADFETLYPRFKQITGFAVQEMQHFEAPHAADRSAFPNLANGDTTGVELAKVLGMKGERVGDPGYFKYRIYQVHLKALIDKNGKMDSINIDADKPLPADKIRAFFMAQTYNMSFLPAEFNKWYFYYFFWGFRNATDEQALAEKAQLEEERRLERQRRMTLDSIDHAYIPRNLEECFVQLDKTLSNINRAEMKAKKSGNDMMIYHLGLGTWMRNTWGLWGGSRLQAYFTKRGATNPEGMSSVVLINYYDWLNGNKDIAQKWETEHPEKN